MDSSYVVRHLGAEQLRQAFPLWQAAHAEVDLEGWLDYAERLCDASPDRCGIITAQSPHGYIHGLFTFVIEADLRCGRILRVDNLLVFGLRKKAVAELLMDAMIKLGAEHSCEAIHIALREVVSDATDLREVFFGVLPEVGFRVESLRVCKRLQNARPLFKPNGDG